MDYEMFEDNNINMWDDNLNQCLDYNLLTESSTIFMLKYLPLPPLDTDTIDKGNNIKIRNMLKKYMELYEDKEKKKLNYLNPILKQQQLGRMYTYKIYNFINNLKEEIANDYGFKNVYIDNYERDIGVLVVEE